MSALYTAILFVHIACAMGYVAGFSIVLGCVLGLRRARTTQALALWAGLATRVTRVVIPVCGAGVVLAGLFMYVVAWRDDGSWVLVALGALVLVGISIGVFHRRWVAALWARAEHLAGEATLPVDLAAAAHAPRVVFVPTCALAVIGGVLWLMVAKPDLVISLVVVAGALVVGLLIAVIVTRPPYATTPAAPSFAPSELEAN